MGYYTKQQWDIQPAALPTVSKNCAKCDTKSSFMNTEKFRINANKGKVDIWMIFQCPKCKSTWNMTLYERISPRSLSKSAYHSFQENHIEAVYQYSFDSSFYQKNHVEMKLSDTDYTIQKTVLAHRKSDTSELYIEIITPYPIRLRLDRLLSEQLPLSRAQTQKYLNSGKISIDGLTNWKKCNLNKSLIIHVKESCLQNSPSAAGY